MELTLRPLHTPGQRQRIPAQGFLIQQAQAAEQPTTAVETVQPHMQQVAFQAQLIQELVGQLLHTQEAVCRPLPTQEAVSLPPRM